MNRDSKVERRKAIPISSGSDAGQHTVQKEQQLPQLVLDVMDDVRKNWSFTQADNVNLIIFSD